MSLVNYVFDITIQIILFGIDLVVLEVTNIDGFRSLCLRWQKSRTPHLLIRCSPRQSVYEANERCSRYTLTTSFGECGHFIGLSLCAGGDRRLAAGDMTHAPARSGHVFSKRAKAPPSAANPGVERRWVGRGPVGGSSPGGQSATLSAGISGFRSASRLLVRRITASRRHKPVLYFERTPLFSEVEIGRYKYSYVRVASKCGQQSRVGDGTTWSRRTHSVKCSPSCSINSTHHSLF